uniref:EF-hand domain-containing protein n=1 Tax=Chrysotila carterae TaxID=13221 RepID=A0A7S4AZY6_CHRCT
MGKATMLVRAGMAVIFLQTACCLEQRRVGAMGEEQAVPLEDTLLNIFDQDKDGQVGMGELTKTLDGLAALGSMSAGAQAQAQETENELQQMLNGAKQFAKPLMKFMDADGSNSLSKDEIVWVSTMYNAVTTPGLLKEVTVAVFEAIDVNKDGSLSQQEIHTAIAGDGYDHILKLLQTRLPLPALAAASSRTAVESKLQDIFDMLDINGDGKLERSEIFSAVKKFKKFFVRGVELAKSVGPMMGMFQAFQESSGGRGSGQARKRQTRTAPLKQAPSV